jgi:hypothetical protein
MEEAKMNLEDIIVLKFREFERRITDLLAENAQLACGQSCRPGCSDSCRSGAKTTLTSSTPAG